MIASAGVALWMYDRGDCIQVVAVSWLILGFANRLPPGWFLPLVQFAAFELRWEGVKLHWRCGTGLMRWRVLLYGEWRFFVSSPIFGAMASASVVVVKSGCGEVSGWVWKGRGMWWFHSCLCLRWVLSPLSWLRSAASGLCQRRETITTGVARRAAPWDSSAAIDDDLSLGWSHRRCGVPEEVLPSHWVQCFFGSRGAQ